jgi:hypothetical protein
VITLGSPVIGGPKYTAVEAEVASRNRQPLETSVTAINSRSDAVVAWRACIDRHTPRVDHVEVETTQLGLGFSPRVYEVIAERLARPDPVESKRGYPRPESGSAPRR